VIPQGNVYISKKQTIDVHVIGYKTAGESIIVNIGNKFAGIIDCYRTKQYFITMDILKDLRIKKLNFICWTHTDEDHTRGLPDILLSPYVGKKTAFILPDGISSKEVLCPQPGCLSDDQPMAMTGRVINSHPHCHWPFVVAYFISR
jgi:ribonuclease BN (tRNA processing enzyme)